MRIVSLFFLFLLEHKTGKKQRGYTKTKKPLFTQVFCLLFKKNLKTFIIKNLTFYLNLIFPPF